MIESIVELGSKSLNLLKENLLAKIVSPEVRDKIEQIKIPENDPFGIRKEMIKATSLVTNFLYKYWNRVEVYGIENVPDEGAAILVPNHGGVLPLDAAYIASSLILEHRQPRLVRSLVERFLPTVPHFYTLITRVGQVVGTYENAEIILKEGELLLIFPEGAKGASKPYYTYYELEDFNVGFLELAIRNKVPIIPVGVIGSHEQALVLFDFKPAAKLFKMPTFPVTPFWPLLGPLGAIPLPAKYRIVFGQPLDFSACEEEILSDPEKVKELVTQVQSEVKKLIDLGLEMRPFPFF